MGSSPICFANIVVRVGSPGYARNPKRRFDSVESGIVGSIPNATALRFTFDHVTMIITNNIWIVDRVRLIVPPC